MCRGLAVGRRHRGPGALQARAGDVHGHARKGRTALVGDRSLDRPGRLREQSGGGDEEKTNRKNREDPGSVSHLGSLLKKNFKKR